MNIRLIFAMLVTGALCLGGSCCKKDPLPIVYLSLEAKSYTDFLNGSWWLYVNTIDSTQTDSVFLANRSIRILQITNQPVEYEELSYITIKKNSIGLYDTVVYELYPPPAIYADAPYFSYYYTNIQKGILGLELIFFPNTVGAKSRYDYAPHIIEKRDSILIQGKYFYNTITTRFDSSEYGNFIKSEIYSKGTGVIKREYFNGDVYELKKYFVKQ